METENKNLAAKASRRQEANTEIKRETNMTNKKKFVVPEYFERFDQKEIDDILEYSHDVYIANRTRELAEDPHKFDDGPDFYDGLRGVTICHIYEAIGRNPHDKTDMDIAKDFSNALNQRKCDMNALMYALMAFKDEENHDACLFIRKRFQEMTEILIQLRRRNPTDEERKLIDGFKAKINDWNWWCQKDQEPLIYTREEYEHGNNEIIIEDDPSKEEML